MSSHEDELCLRLGRALAAQDVQRAAQRAPSRAQTLFGRDTYGPNPLLDAFSETIASEAFRVVPAVDTPHEQQRRWRLLLALARIVPYPDARIPIGDVEDLRESVGAVPYRFDSQRARWLRIVVPGRVRTSRAVWPLDRTRHHITTPRQRRPRLRYAFGEERFPLGP